MPENTFLKRTVTGTIFGIIVLSLLWLDYVGISIFLGLVCLLCNWEVLDVLSFKHNKSMKIIALTCLVLPFAYTLVLLHFLSVPEISIGVSLPVFLLIYTVLNIKKEAGLLFENIMKFSSGIMLITLPCICGLVVLDHLGENIKLVFLGVILLIWTNDVFAYLIGSKFGKHAMIPKISPKKTWEGTIGGGILTICISGILFLLFGVLDMSDWIIFGFLVAVFGTLGDMIESSAKRWANVKDSGSLLPGHGGFWDRFDSLLGVLPVLAIYLLLFH